MYDWDVMLNNYMGFRVWAYSFDEAVVMSKQRAELLCEKLLPEFGDRDDFKVIKVARV